MASYATAEVLHRKIILPALILLISTGALIYIGGADLVRTIKNIPLPSLCALLILPCLRWLFLLTRLQLLFKAKGLKFRNRDVLATQWAYDFAAETTPGNIGGPLVVFTCCKIFNIPISTATSMSILTLTLDVAAASIIFSIALATSDLIFNQSIHWQLLVFFTFVFSVVVLLWILTKHRRSLQRQIIKLNPTRWLKKHRARKLQKFWIRHELALKRMSKLNMPSMLLIAFSSAGIWACRLSIVYFVIQVIPEIHHISWPDALIIQFISSVAGIVVLLPGGLLGADITIAALLSPLFDIKTITAVILLWRLLTFHINFVVGSLSFIWISSKIIKAPFIENTATLKSSSQK